MNCLKSETLKKLFLKEVGVNVSFEYSRNDCYCVGEHEFEIFAAEEEAARCPYNNVKLHD